MEGWIIFLFVAIFPKYAFALCFEIPFAPSFGQNCSWPFASSKCPTKWIASFVNKKKLWEILLGNTVLEL